MKASGLLTKEALLLFKNLKEQLTVQRMCALDQPQAYICWIGLVTV